jgi:putative transposase
MRRRRNPDQVARLLQEADRDLAKGLTVRDICRKLGIAQTTYHPWRQRHEPARVDTDRRCRELEVEVERLKLLVAERRESSCPGMPEILIASAPERAWTDSDTCPRQRTGRNKA